MFIKLIKYQQFSKDLENPSFLHNLLYPIISQEQGKLFQQSIFISVFWREKTNKYKILLNIFFYYQYLLFYTILQRFCWNYPVKYSKLIVSLSKVLNNE